MTTSKAKSASANTINDIKKLAAAGNNATFIRSTLIVNGKAKTDKDANELLKQAGIVSARPAESFRDRLYADLIAGKTWTKDEFAKHTAKESKNVQAHTNYYYGIVELAAKVRANKAK